MPSLPNPKMNPNQNVVIMCNWSEFVTASLSTGVLAERLNKEDESDK